VLFTSRRNAGARCLIQWFGHTAMRTLGASLLQCSSEPDQPVGAYDDQGPRAVTKLGVTTPAKEGHGAGASAFLAHSAVRAAVITWTAI